MLRLLSATAVALAVTAAPAAAKVAHTVAPGETLWSIAAASNLTTRTLAAFNGLPEDAHVVLGSTIWIPSEAEGAAALRARGIEPGSPLTRPAARQPAARQPAAPPPLGAYVVRPGDTLSGIAARAGVSMEQIAAANGLSVGGILPAGLHLKLPAGAPQAQPAAQTQPAVAQAQPAAAPAEPAPAVPDAPPHPTPERVSAEQIAQLAAEHGVPPSLALAVAWQESGFNNAVVSPANARGVMQIIPGTWRWIQDNLAGGPLNPASAYDNVHAGVMYLQRLLRDTGGDPAQAAAAYYQGLGSVRSRGWLPETQRYVADVMALRRRFGGN